MRIITIIGARPQFVKAAPVSRALRKSHTEVLVHTGQHYDHDMSGAFFDELGIPKPDYLLGVGSGNHGAQTGRMLEQIENVLLKERPDAVMVYGDTNSTLAGALAATKIGIPVVHVEAGLRSFDMRMPEEINRVLTDRVSSLLLCPSSIAVNHLRSEGITNGVHIVGDVMFDALLHAMELSKSDVGHHHGSKQLHIKEPYVLATVHRAENTDDAARLGSILKSFGGIGYTVILPLHPRTRAVIDREEISIPSNVKVVEPLSYVALANILAKAKFVLTDSGGLQKEAYWLKVPCITLRESTEWSETVSSGWNRLVGADADRIAAAAASVNTPDRHEQLYGAPGAAERVVKQIEHRFG